ncbi:MAG: lycopene cyclase domain-containing protein [Candidatus Gottesmanbacteria bacterium]|nr:lycopene cyclase domain-containing protein [Candidatus Gottesmanbacteria bacterium]
MSEYVTMLVGLFVIATLVHHIFHLRVYASVKQAIIVHTFGLIVGIMWDQYAIWRGLWAYNKQFLLGSWIGYMPLEDYGFVLIVPYVMFVVAAFVKKKIK